MVAAGPRLAVGTSAVVTVVHVVSTGVTKTSRMSTTQDLTLMT